ncbi:MAG: TIGR02265 family protein [Candidatus Thermoplasmatota archaeon]|nr:TIGR02265 family protein [Candidatus Thermoplasmatota archaeon]
MGATGCITGASTMLVVSWLEEQQGPGHVETLFHRLRTERGHAVARDHFHPKAQVDYRLHVDVLEEIAALTQADDDGLRAMGATGAEKVEEVVPGAKLMLKMASPKRLLKHAPRLWGTYADFGGVEVLELSKRSAKLRIHGFEPHHHFCRTLEGFFEALLQRVGAEDVHVREIEHAAGQTGCVFEGRWT